MKKIKYGILMILLVSASFLLSGCGKQEETETMKKEKGVFSEIVESILPFKESEEELAKRYYTYLNEEVVVDRGSTYMPVKPVPLAPSEFYMRKDTLDRYGEEVYFGRYVGPMSAFLEDFDHDGILDMLLVEMHYDNLRDTKYWKIFYDPEEEVDSRIEEQKCGIFLNCNLYSMDENGEIIEKDNCSYAYMPTDSWGRILVGIEKVDEDYYLFGYSTSENMSTYGPKHLVVTNLSEVERYMNWQYTSLVDYGRANASNYRELMNIGYPITIHDTTLSKLKFEPEPDLGNRLVTMIDFKMEDRGKDAYVIITPRDYTNLRVRLEENGENWERIELPQGGKIEFTDNQKAEKRIEEITEELNQAVGTVYNFRSKTENEDTVRYNYMSTNGTKIYFVWNMVEEEIEQIEVVGAGYDVDAEWEITKDVILGLTDFSLSQSDADEFKGEITRAEWSKYMGNANGMNVGGCNIELIWVDYPCFTIRKSND